MRWLLALGLLALVPRVATAHFKLLSPESWRVLSEAGDPQKVGPCGDEGAAPTTGVVTAFRPGETITITLDETIFHPGHYRVALAVNDRSELPPEPEVTPGVTPCGSAPIMDPVALPVLADGALVHAEPFSGTQFIDVTLPTDVTCTHCTLQVLEFMSEHSAPCFYHHCADISIAAPPPPPGCVADADCADANLCTTDRCKVAAGTCENVADVAATCDDGYPCTRDACTAAQGCVALRLTLANVTSEFLGTLDVPACAGERIPPGIAGRFLRASALVTRAAARPLRAPRLLARARRRLHRAAKRVAAMEPGAMSVDCATALSAALAQAEVSVQCLD